MFLLLAWPWHTPPHTRQPTSWYMIANHISWSHLKHDTTVSAWNSAQLNWVKGKRDMMIIIPSWKTEFSWISFNLKHALRDVCHFSLNCREDGLICRGTVSVVSWAQSQQGGSIISPVDSVFHVHVLLFMALIKVINGTNHQHGGWLFFVFNV